ncbi:Putative zinc/iron permease [Septoria linicola]|uniref:Zinc/iron permease n=1 Tax=Septoria linicola TaxID=215465 RepID=A0A9Q9EEH9_9PEZI|nr:putative zinc/iron permease [Septoria linicola]USW46934.1 Putative zinc/iron permease [Septoria linicola]
MTRRNYRNAALTVVALLAYSAYAQVAREKVVTAVPVDRLSTQEIEEQLQSCSILQQITAHNAEHHPVTSSWLSRAFAVLFPFTSPALNALMGTLYISGPPNFLLALCPPNIDPSSLNIMVAFAVGGLLGDTLFHLLPEIFLGEVPEGEVRAVFVEPNKNLLLGVAIMVGFVTFVGMDKGLRIATGGAGHSHDHSGHAQETNGQAVASATGIAMPSEKELKKRGGKQDKSIAEAPKAAVEEPAKKEVKLSAYLNIIADFTHNITDGLAMSSSFYASPTIGATTTLAVFCHEIPHEVGDFALLIQGGMSKKLAMGLQFVTALGAVLGTLIGIAVQEFGGNAASVVQEIGVGNTGLWGTSLQWGDMLLPFTAGTFLYVGTVGVIPEMLETGPNVAKELRTTALQFLAMAAGAGIMLGISWS